jgi:hypothetical protein
MLRTVELERDRLVDRHRRGFRRGVAVVAGVNRNRLSLHAFNKPRSQSDKDEIRGSARPFTSNSLLHSEPEPTPSHG